VTANYKLSFDKLREKLAGRNAWILVLDTKGINVWCAAGKGTFGTEELVTRIRANGLAQVVSHRKLILPQLAGPGISAHAVQKTSGFKVIYGPIRSADLPAFLDADLQATPEMRRKTFTFWERMVLVPMELVGACKAAFVVLLVLVLLGSLLRPGGFMANLLGHGPCSVIAIVASVLTGAVLTPLLLPWLPGRAFALKGLIPGSLAFLAFVLLRWDHGSAWPDRLEIVSWLPLVLAISAYLAMNFTGASTYTSLSGVKKEMRWALPFQIGAGILGLGLWVVSHLVA
jgi:acetyl-CoA decarbonylase/synthase complex subunit gamma